MSYGRIVEITDIAACANSVTALTSATEITFASRFLPGANMHTDHIHEHSDCATVNDAQTAVLVGSTILLVAGSFYATQISDNPFVFLNVLAVFIFGLFTGVSALAELKASNTHSKTVIVALSIAIVLIAFAASWFVWMRLMAGI